jgi:hypothetical protein
LRLGLRADTMEELIQWPLLFLLVTLGRHCRRWRVPRCE